MASSRYYMFLIRHGLMVLVLAVDAIRDDRGTSFRQRAHAQPHQWQSKHHHSPRRHADTWVIILEILIIISSCSIIAAMFSTDSLCTAFLKKTGRICLPILIVFSVLTTVSSLGVCFLGHYLECETLKIVFPSITCNSLPSATVIDTVVPPSALHNATVESLKGGIPKVVHQIWWDSRPLNTNEAKWMQSWNSSHPDWLHVLWRHSDLRTFMAMHHPTALPLYDSYTHSICKIDMVRYHILWTHGGLYVDIDYEAISSIEPELEGHGLAVVDSPFKKHEDVQNSMMASRPNHPFWVIVSDILRERSSLCSHVNPDIIYTTGPGVLSEAVRRYSSGSKSQPMDDLHRLKHSTCMFGEGKAIAKHHYEHLWMETLVQETFQRYAAYTFVVALVVTIVLTLVFCVATTSTYPGKLSKDDHVNSILGDFGS